MLCQFHVFSSDQFSRSTHQGIIQTPAVVRFRGHCESLAVQLEEPAHNVWEALSQDWLYIQERTFAFDTRNQQVWDSLGQGQLV